MFIKFVRFHGDTHTDNTVECLNYEAYHHIGGDITITTYPKHTNTDGVERHITKDENRTGRYDAAFVMSDTGKTIESYRV